MSNKVEYRGFGVELRAEPGTSRVLTGYIACYDTESNPLDGFNEIIRKGAFTDTLKNNRDIKALYNHNSDKPLGRTPLTLTLSEDNVGLAFKLDTAETTTGNDLLVSVKRGDVNQASFGFMVIRDNWIERDGGMQPLRELLEIELHEISVGVVFPAYEKPSTYVRFLNHKTDRTMQERYLREIQRFELELLELY